MTATRSRTGGTASASRLVETRSSTAPTRSTPRLTSRLSRSASSASGGLPQFATTRSATIQRLAPLERTAGGRISRQPAWRGVVHIELFRTARRHRVCRQGQVPCRELRRGPVLVRAPELDSPARFEAIPGARRLRDPHNHGHRIREFETPGLRESQDRPGLQRGGRYRGRVGRRNWRRRREQHTRVPSGQLRSAGHEVCAADRKPEPLHRRRADEDALAQILSRRLPARPPRTTSTPTSPATGTSTATATSASKTATSESAASTGCPR